MNKGGNGFIWNNVNGLIVLYCPLKNFRTVDQYILHQMITSNMFTSRTFQNKAMSQCLEFVWIENDTTI